MFLSLLHFRYVLPTVIYVHRVILGQINQTFPINTVEAYAELYASGNGNEEFWVRLYSSLQKIAHNKV